MVLIIINTNFKGREGGKVYHSNLNGGTLNLKGLGMVVHVVNQNT